MSNKPKTLPPAIRTKPLYCVHYFRGVVSGPSWIGKELFHAVDLKEAIRLGNIRGTRLGYNTYTHLWLE